MQSAANLIWIITRNPNSKHQEWTEESWALGYLYAIINILKHYFL